MSKKKRRRNIPPATMLRPRMDNLWADEALLHKDDAAIKGDLDVLSRDVSPELFVKTMLRAYKAASEAVQSRLDEVIPGWLAASGYDDTLKQMAREELGPELRRLALSWLKATGMDVRKIKSRPALFLDALYHDDEERLFGDKSQAFLAIFWYVDARKRRAQAMGVLLDYNPPWDGSVKDIFVTPRQPAKKLIEYFTDSISMPLESIRPERAKTVMLASLQCNREAEIRLPRDLIRARDVFERQVLSLPDGPETPEFTMEDFEYLARHGENPEQITNFEKNVGRRIRTEDGEEILVMGSIDEDEMW